MEELRKIEYRQIVDNAKEPELRRGYFHKFIGGYMSQEMAIVERRDGTITTVNITDIRFIDRETVGAN